MSPHRILIVEDDPTMLRALKDNFEFKGYRVATAADGEQGLEQARTSPPDLMILDIMLPKVNGYEVCRLLRSEGFDAPIVMLTAKGQESDIVLGLSTGADDYITKPFSIRELLARVEAMLRRRQQTARRERDYESRLRSMVDQLSTHERDLQAALSFQESLLGRPRERPGLNIAAEHRFCDTMGGDFYDILDAGDGATGLLMADVSGHGVPAALVTGMLKAQIRASRHRRDPVEFLKDLNRHLFPTLSVKGQFLTAAYAVADPSGRSLAYASAGHNPLAVVRQDAGVEEHGSTGFPVGMLEELDVESGSLRLEPGDAVWLYTDGLFESPGPEGRGYGRHALVELIGQARHADIARWARNVFSSCQDFLEGRPPADDMTLVCAMAVPGS